MAVKRKAKSAKLRPIVEALQVSALGLLDAMIQVGRDAATEGGGSDGQ